LYEIAFGFLPRKFDSTDDDKVIYDEDQEVSEMYFVQDGFVGIGFTLLSNGLTGRSHTLSKNQSGRQLIGDHYVINKSNSKFIYIAQSPTKCFALQRRFLHSVIFPKYPDYEIIIRSQSYNYYKKWIFKPVDNHRRKELA